MKLLLVPAVSVNNWMDVKPMSFHQHQVWEHVDKRTKPWTQDQKGWGSILLC